MILLIWICKYLVLTVNLIIFCLISLCLKDLCLKCIIRDHYNNLSLFTFNLPIYIWWDKDYEHGNVISAVNLYKWWVHWSSSWNEVNHLSVNWIDLNVFNQFSRMNGTNHLDVYRILFRCVTHSGSNLFENYPKRFQTVCCLNNNVENVDYKCPKLFSNWDVFSYLLFNIIDHPGTIYIVFVALSNLLNPNFSYESNCSFYTYSYCCHSNIINVVQVFLSVTVENVLNGYLLYLSKSNVVYYVNRKVVEVMVLYFYDNGSIIYLKNFLLGSIKCFGIVFKCKDQCVQFFSILNRTRIILVLWNMDECHFILWNTSCDSNALFTRTYFFYKNITFYLWQNFKVFSDVSNNLYKVDRCRNNCLNLNHCNHCSRILCLL